MKRRFPFVSSTAWLVLAAAPCASASPATFAIDPTQSVVAISGSLDLDLGPLGSVLPMPLATQLGSQPGVAGATIGDGSTSDGLRTSLTGTLFADVGASTIRFYGEHAVIQAATSGSWAPAVPPDAGAVDAQLGAEVDSGLGFATPAAIRASLYTLSSDPLPLSGVGGIRHFPASEIFRPVKGFVDYGLPPFSARAYLAELVEANGGAEGTIESLGGSQVRVTIPVSIPVPLGSAYFTALPLSLDATLSGQIVATATVPEPGAAWLGLAALAALAVLRQPSRLRRKERALRFLCGGLVLVACTQGISNGACHKDEDCLEDSFCDVLRGWCMPKPKRAAFDPAACDAQHSLVANPDGTDMKNACGDDAAVDLPDGDGFERCVTGTRFQPSGVELFYECNNSGNVDPTGGITEDTGVQWHYNYTGAQGDKLVLYLREIALGDPSSFLLQANGIGHCGANGNQTFQGSDRRIVFDVPDGNGACSVTVDASMQTTGHGAQTAVLSAQARVLSGCTSDGECPSGHCVSGVCTNGALDDPCIADTDCEAAAGLVCSSASQSCTDGGAGRPCVFDSDCHVGLHCDDQHGECAP